MLFCCTYTLVLPQLALELGLPGISRRADLPQWLHGKTPEFRIATSRNKQNQAESKTDAVAENLGVIVALTALAKSDFTVFYVDVTNVFPVEHT